MIIDINTILHKNNNYTEVSYKIVDFQKCTRIKSFICKMNEKFTYEWFVNFFSCVSAVFTIGEEKKNFIKQFFYNVYDLYSDDIHNLTFKRCVHTRLYPLRPAIVKNWKNPSKCPSSKCRYSHSGKCSFNNVQCMIEWLNDPVF